MPSLAFALVFGLVFAPVFAPAFAQEAAPAPVPTLPFEEALDRAAEANASVRAARLDLATAERDLERVRADPTTLRIARLQAEQSHQRAVAALAAATESARDAAATAYENALQADDRVAIAEAALAIAASLHDAARIRFEAGAATRLDLERAANDVQAAARDLDDARQTRDLAYQRLASQVGDAEAPIALTPAPPPGPVPDLDQVRTWAEENRTVLAAAHQLALAEAQLTAIDVPLTTPRADIEAARDRVDTARLQLDEQRRVLDLELQQARNAAVAAAARLQSADEAVVTAEEDVRVQRLRFEAGTVAQLTLAQSELQASRQRAARTTAEHTLAASLRRLSLLALGAGPGTGP
ncbi:MAG: TolC family protein [Trueperaceae bacterium]